MGNELAQQILPLVKDLVHEVLRQVKNARQHGPRVDTLAAGIWDHGAGLGEADKPGSDEGADGRETHLREWLRTVSLGITKEWLC